MTPFLSGTTLATTSELAARKSRSAKSACGTPCAASRRCDSPADAAGFRLRRRTLRPPAPTCWPVSVLRIAQGFKQQARPFEHVARILLGELAVDDVAVFVADVAAGDILRFGPRREHRIRLRPARCSPDCRRPRRPARTACAKTCTRASGVTFSQLHADRRRRSLRPA